MPEFQKSNHMSSVIRLDSVEEKGQNMLIQEATGDLPDKSKK